MAYLNKTPTYDIEDSNIALLGSDLELRVREHAGDRETAWQTAGHRTGTVVWRIEKFHVVAWPEERYGTFYDGDSYIVLHTYRPNPEADDLAYNLHFWLGQQTSQDEAGTAAYKAVELDDHLHGKAVQYREVHGSESATFLSYFDHFLSISGGIETGFHHVSKAPLDLVTRLYRIETVKIHTARGVVPHSVIRQVQPSASSLAQGNVFILDRGESVLQYNLKTASGKEKFKAAEFLREIVDGRQRQCQSMVYDEGESGAGVFLSALGSTDTRLPPGYHHPESEARDKQPETSAIHPDISVFRLSDASGSPTFSPVSSDASVLSSLDAFLIDAASEPSPAIYAWIGSEASLTERRLVLPYAQRYLHEKKARDERVNVRIPIVSVKEGAEDDTFRRLFI